MIASECDKSADTVNLLSSEPHRMQEQEQLENLLRVFAEEFFSLSPEEQARDEQPTPIARNAVVNTACVRDAVQ